MAEQSIRIAVIMGGISAERDGSLEMGRNCAQALRSLGHDVVEIDATPGSVAQDLIDAKPDFVFNSLMGRWGEDGVVQGLLEWLDLPYTHSGVTASAIGMDKRATRAVYQANGLPVAPGQVVSRAALPAGHPIDPPYVLKPVAEGSSIGIDFVWAASDPVPELPSEAGDEILVEKLVPRLDRTATVLDDRPFVVTQIETASGVWDYQSKYSEPHARYQSPAPIPERITEACLDLALKAHKALGCRCVSRTDMRWDASRDLNGFIVLETNTQPAVGYDSVTTIDQQLSSRGISLAEYCQRLVNDAALRR